MISSLVGRRWWLGMVVLAMALLLGNCSSLKSDSDEDEKPAKLIDFEPEVEVDLLWRRKVGEGSGDAYAKLYPQLASGYVVVADAYGMVSGLEVRTGKVGWRTRIGRIRASMLDRLRFWSAGVDRAFVTGGVGGQDDLVVVGTEGGEVIALNAGSGDPAWRVRLSSEVLAPAAVDSDRVAVQTSDGKLYSLDRSTGSTQWTYDVQVPVLTLRGTSSPVLSGGRVITGFANGRIVTLGAEQGNVIWEQRVSLPQGRSELERMVDVDGTPLAGGAVVYAGAYQGGVKAFSLADGRTLWEYEGSSFSRLGHGFGYIYLVTEDGRIVALTENGGTKAWQQDGLRQRGVTGAVVLSSYLAVGDSKGYLHLFAQSDGRPVGRRRIGGGALQSVMVVSGGVLYGTTDKGQVFAAEARRP